MKKILSLILAVVMLLVPVESFAAPQKQLEKIGPQIKNTTAIVSAAGTNSRGTALMYVVLQGQPAKLAVVDIVKNQLVDVKPLGDSTSAWAITVDSKRTVWIGGTPSAHLFSYNPDAQKLTDLGKAAGKSSTSIHDLEVGANGEIYGGASYGGNVFKYVPGKGFSDLGQVWPLKQSVRSLAYNKGKNIMFAGVGSKADLIAWNLSTNKKQSILPAAYRGKTAVMDLKIARGILFAKVDADKKMLMFNANTFQFLGQFDAVSHTVSELAPDGQSIYFSKDYHLYRRDLASGSEEEINGTLVGTEAVSISIVHLHDNQFPGYSVVSLLGNSGTFGIYNKETNHLLIEKLPLPEQATPIYNIEKGLNGTIYSSGYVSGQMAILNPATNQTTMLNLGQAEGMTSLGGKMYLGIYPGAHIFEYRPGGVPRELFTVDNGQERPVAMVGVENYNRLFIGTDPRAGEVGGALVSYDVKSRAKMVRRNLVPNQSIISLTYQNGYVYGGTSIFSGKNLEGKATAVLFRIKASQPGGKIEILPFGIKYPRMIHALAVGPDNRIWGLSDGNLFAYDPVKKKAMSIKVVPNTSGRFRNGALAGGKDGYMYGTVEKRLFRVNAKTMKLEFLSNIPAEDMALDDSGHIYFSEQENLWRYQP